MRQRTTVAIGLAAALGLWAAFILKTETIRITDPPEPIGGLSGLVVSADGGAFTAISDRNMLIRGDFLRDEGQLTGAEVKQVGRLRDAQGRELVGPWNDAEGLAINADGLPVVSFETLLRVRVFGPDLRERPLPELPPTDLYHANLGFEALALDAEGRAILISEKELRDGETAVILRQTEDSWAPYGSLSIDRRFSPTGADFGPDGALYVLERQVGLLGLRSRIRRVVLTGEEGQEGEVLWAPRQSYGNLEGLSLWTDAAGALRATMVADDNQLPFLPGGFAEIILAKPGAAE